MAVSYKGLDFPTVLHARCGPGLLSNLNGPLTFRHN